MKLNLRPAEECTFDAVSLGEVMLRLDPGEGRIRTARSFRAWEGGGEYNVIRGLHKCFGMRTAVITAFADNEVGLLMKDFIEQGGVDTSLICWKKTDGIGRLCRNGLNFTERGFGIRGAKGCSDRANTAISQATPEDFDFDYIFKNKSDGGLGVRWLHTGGIYAALSEQACETVIAACKAAKKYGTIVSYDLNYRPSMWEATATYPNFKAVATTLRQVKTATVNDWSAICWADGEIYKAAQYDGLEIMDRVGGGDSFASGLVYGLMTFEDAEKAVNYGAAHGALAMTTPGDTTMASLKEVEGIVGGAGARVQR